MASVRALPDAVADALGLAGGARAAAHPIRRASSRAPGERRFVSPFDEAAVCAIDGFGDFVSTSWGRVAGHAGCRSIGHVFFPHSLGMLYLAITQYLGFPNYGDEFKVMGLAPYGEPRFVERDSARSCTLAAGRRLRAGPRRTSATGPAACRMTWDDGEPTIGTVFTPKLEVAARSGAPAATSRSTRATRRSPRRCRPSSRRRPSTCCAAVHAATGAAAAVPRRRLRDEQRRQRQDPRAQPPFTRRLHPAGGRRQRHRARRGVLRAGIRSAGQPRGFVMEHGYWGPSFDDGAIAAALDARAGGDRRARLRAARDRTTRPRSDDWTAAQHRRRPRRRLVPGADGVGRARARQPQHPRRPAPRRHARHHQHARSSSARSSARSRRRCSRKRSTSTSSARCPTRS